MKPLDFAGLKRLLDAVPVKPVVRELQLGLVERGILRARADKPTADALTARLQQRLAAHSDRALLKGYEDTLAD